jgi:hypothetical protein
VRFDTENYDIFLNLKNMVQFFFNSAHNIFLSSKKFPSLTTHNYLPSLKSACPITNVNQKCRSLNVLNSIKHGHELLFMNYIVVVVVPMCAVFMVYQWHWV